MLIVCFQCFRENDRNPHPRFRNGDPHDGHRWHGDGPPTNPQPAPDGRPHCQLPSQRRLQRSGTSS